MNRLIRQSRRGAARELLRRLNSGPALTLAEYALAEELLEIALRRRRADLEGCSEGQAAVEVAATNSVGQLRI